MDWVSQRPQLTEEQVVALALERFGLDGRLEWLDGERDQNARLHTARGSFVLKLSNPLEEQAVVELQNEALRRLAQRGVPGVPLVVAGLDGADIQRVNVGTDSLLFRALSWIDGLPLATVKPHGPELLQQLGERLATHSIGSHVSA